MNRPLTGIGLGAAVRTPGYWLIAGAVLCFGGGIVGLLLHFVPIMVWKGATEVQGALLLTTMGVISIPMVIGFGWLADRRGRPMTGALMASLVAVGVLLLLFGPPSIWWLVAAVIFLAPLQGLFPIVWSMVGEIFGRRSYSTIRGSFMAVQMVSAGLLPTAAGFLFENTGSYAIALWVFFALWGASALLLALTPRHSHA